MQTEKLLLPRWIIPLEGKTEVLENYGLAIENGRIAALIPPSDLENVEAKEVFELPDSVVMPGFVNCHTHASMNLLRCVGPDLTAPNWLTKCIWPIEGQLMSPEFVYDGALLGGAEMLQGGTTTCHDMYFFPDSAAKALREVGLRVVQGAFVIKYPNAEYKGEEDALAGARALAARHKDDPGLSINIAPHAPYSVTAEALQASMRLAEELDTTWQIHLSETEEERQNAIKEFGCSPVEYLAKLGCLNERTVAVHCVALSDHDIELLAESGASVVHCPVSNMRLGCGASPVVKLLKAGVNVALGTDGAANACSLSMFEQMRTAGLIAKGFSQDPTQLTVNQIIRMATINGANALKLDREVGSLAVGKFADLAVIDMSQLVTMPVLDVLSNVIYAVEAQCIHQVWASGCLVANIQQEKLLRPDRGKLLTKSNIMSWQNRVCEILRDDFN
ncbi:MAG TPA: chlorohydrolase [Sutterellaceae bacterium]|uniref:amidohydrolase family protein n=1 Tax=Parasutterella sp. TaxID=2049037 RepID=UPI000E95518C|nr:chlorohydrolase [Sutterellaceae bacterium]